MTSARSTEAAAPVGPPFAAAVAAERAIARRRARVAVPPIPPRRTRTWVRAAYRFFATLYFRLEHHGREHVPADGPAVLVGNHPSYFDPHSVGYGLERWITWMAWDEAFAWPVVGKLVSGLGAFPVNLDRPQPSALKTAQAVLDEGRLLGIFFEGGRTPAGEWQLGEPRPGAALIALKAGVPVVPFSIAGKRRAWPRDGVPRPGKVVVRYHPPLDAARFRPDLPTRRRAELLTEELAARVRAGLPPDGRARPRRRQARAGW